MANGCKITEETMKPKSVLLLLWSVVCLVGLGLGTTAHAQTKKPNILVIWGDDVGWSNVSAYNI